MNKSRLSANPFPRAGLSKHHGWFPAALVALTLSSGLVAGTINPPAMTEVTAKAGETRLGPVKGGICMATSGIYFVATGTGNGFDPTVRAWKNNDTVKWTWSPGFRSRQRVPARSGAQFDRGQSLRLHGRGHGVLPGCRDR